MSRLDEIQARAAAATEGPWAIWHDLDHQGFYTVGDEAGLLTDEKPETDECNPTAHVYIEDDAEFIAHSRDDVEWLLNRVRELEARAYATPITVMAGIDADWLNKEKATAWYEGFAVGRRPVPPGPPNPPVNPYHPRGVA